MPRGSIHSQPSCPVCLCLSGSYFKRVGDFRIYKCCQCGLEHTWPLPSEVQVQSFYATYKDVRAEPEIVRINARRNLAILGRFGYTSDNLVLDFGTGHGLFIEVAGENCYGVDFNSAKHPRIFQNLGELPIENFDVVTLWGVLEHLVDPHRVINQINKFLKPGGLIALTTVNAEGDIPYFYKPIEHLTYWTSASIEHLLRTVSIDIVEIIPYTMIQHSMIYAQRLLSRTPANYRLTFQEAAARLPFLVEVPTNEVLVVGKKS